MSEVQQVMRPTTGAPPTILLGMTAVTGMVDAVSFLALGHVFTANMTGNIVFLGFAIGGAEGLSVSGSLMAYADHEQKIFSVIALTAVAMGLRNSVVRKLAIPDLTTTVLTLTIAGLAADSSLVGGDNLRWQRRGAAILAIIAGAAAGASMLSYSVAVPLLVCGLISGICALIQMHLESKRSL
jgi:uncharacterized membrane protein YoaK (UPF0700 family)